MTENNYSNLFKGGKIIYLYKMFERKTHFQRVNIHPSKSALNGCELGVVVLGNIFNRIERRLIK